MPLLSPQQIHEVLREETPSLALPQTLAPIEKLLKKTGMTSEEVLEHVGHEMRCGDTSSARLSAAKIGLELNGLLKEEAVRPMSVTIIINDSQFNGVNPILIPR